MEIRKETKWLCENARALERFSGKWVMFSAMEGLVRNDESLKRLMRAARKIRLSEKPFVFHVPSKDELAQPLPGARRR
ncbi:MAG: hypothetical protein JO102_04670 [Elusimicrobia bacterium]|nr:hypothetical protein [Elusimicrobiota bacterium]